MIRAKTLTHVKRVTCSNCCIIIALVTVIILISYWDIGELAWNSSKNVLSPYCRKQVKSSVASTVKWETLLN